MVSVGWAPMVSVGCAARAGPVIQPDLGRCLVDPSREVRGFPDVFLAVALIAVAGRGEVKLTCTLTLALVLTLTLDYSAEGTHLIAGCGEVEGDAKQKIGVRSCCQA